MPMTSDDRYCMLPSNDTYRNSKVDLTLPGVVTMDTTVVPDVFKLHALDERAPVVRRLPEHSPEYWFRMTAPNRWGSTTSSCFHRKAGCLAHSLLL